MYVISITHQLIELTLSIFAGTVQDPVTGKSLTFQQAFDQGILDSSKSSIILPSSGHSLELEDAIREGVFDPRTGTITDPGVFTI